MEWLSLLKAVGEFGIMAVICAIFLYQNNKSNDQQQQLMSQLFNQMIQQNEQMHASMANIANHGSHVLTEEEDQNAKRIDKAINTYLQQLVATCHSSRAFVARYHNGGKDMTATSFLKLSCTNEVVNIGYSPVISDFQNQFRSMISIICEQLDETGESYIYDLETIHEEDTGTYEFLKGRGVKSLYAKALRNQNGYVIGFVMVSYTEQNEELQDAVVIKRELQDKANKISALLCL